MCVCVSFFCEQLSCTTHCLHKPISLYNTFTIPMRTIHERVYMAQTFSESVQRHSTRTRYTYIELIQDKKMLTFVVIYLLGGNQIGIGFELVLLIRISFRVFFSCECCACGSHAVNINKKSNHYENWLGRRVRITFPVARKDAEPSSNKSA